MKYLGRRARLWGVAVVVAVLVVLGSSLASAQTPDSTYRVRAGDTYVSIAQRHGISLDLLQDLNPTVSVYRSPRWGDRLRVPIAAVIGRTPSSCPQLHVVNPNETLQWIGAAYRVAVPELAWLNNLPSNAPVYPGYALCLPAHARLSGAPAASAVPVPRTRTGPAVPSVAAGAARAWVGPWTGYYYNYLQSPQPAVTRQDPNINFAWGDASPGAGLGHDHFSAVWLGRHAFSGQTYRFVALADDGVRVWIGNALVIDGWRDQSATLFYKDYAPPRGTHQVRVEYYDSGRTAHVSVNWAPR